MQGSGGKGGKGKKTTSGGDKGMKESETMKKKTMNGKQVDGGKETSGGKGDKGTKEQDDGGKGDKGTVEAMKKKAADGKEADGSKGTSGGKGDKGTKESTDGKKETTNTKDKGTAKGVPAATGTEKPVVYATWELLKESVCPEFFSDEKKNNLFKFDTDNAIYTEPGAGKSKRRITTNEKGTKKKVLKHDNEGNKNYYMRLSQRDEDYLSKCQERYEAWRDCQF